MVSGRIFQNLPVNVIALQKEHNLTLLDEFHFKYAQVALAADSTRIALESVNEYLKEHVCGTVLC